MKRPARLSQFVLSLGMTFAMGAEALTLGRLNVLSSLGQPLIAEIEVPEISPDEANSIRVGMASPEAFKSAGLDYTPAVSQVTVIGKRRADGRAILELRSPQPISAPYLDLVLEVIWNNGRMLRDYTVLLDPPAATAQPLVIPAPTLPIQSLSITPNQATSVAPPPLQAPDPAPKTVALPPISSATQSSARRTVDKQSSNKAGVTTKRGDTAAAIAFTIKPDGVSLDQMLVAMLRTNPDAFVAGNVNRLKSGVVIEAPSEESIRSVPHSDAKNNIQAQAKDFNEYRRKLSSNVAIADAGQAGRSVSGKVVADVADRQTAVPKDDKLTLAKPTPNANPEVKIAQDRAAADAAARASELKKNIAELSKLTPPTVPALPNMPSAPVVLATPVMPAAVSAPVSTAVSSPSLPPPLPVRPPVRPPVQPIETSFLDQVIVSPLTLPIAGGLGVLVLLAGWFGIRKRRQSSFDATQNATQGFAETRAPSDTIFGPMGASDVDTKVSPVSTTMMYSPSQLSSTTNDVDPIAEANVYLAYNRDVQAEEILKAAKLEQPKRADVQAKLLELYAKRRDVDSFNLGAEDLHRLTQGEGDDWARVRTIAGEIGSKHPLFTPSFVATLPNSPSTGFATTQPLTTEFATLSPTQAPPTITPAPAAPGLIDFDLNHFTLDLPEYQPQSQVQPPFVAEPIFAATAPPSATIEDPKLALAEEYLSIGDHAGARALIEQVIKQNVTPQIVTQAHQMLARLG